MTVHACHNCRTQGTEKCLVCRKIDHDDYRIAHTPHAASEAVALAVHPSAPMVHPVACVKIRTRSEETEAELLKLIHEFAQTPLPAVIALHGLLNRKTLVEIATEQGTSKQALNGALHRAEKRVKWLARFRDALRRPSTGL